MVSSIIDVSGWQIRLQWAARHQPAAEIAALALRSRDQFVHKFPTFEGTWQVSSEAGSVDHTNSGVPELVRSSLVRVDGEPDPARGLSFLLVSPLVDGTYAAIRVRAGAAHQTRRLAPNSVSVDFSSENMGAPVVVGSSEATFEAFADLAAALERLWDAASMRVSEHELGSILGQ